MIVKKYKAPTEKEAVLAAKEDLGANAVVLNVKTMKQRGIARLFKKDFVEITAALEEKEFEQKVVSRKPTFDERVSEPVKVPDNAVANAIEAKLDNLHNMLQNQIVKEEVKGTDAQQEEQAKEEKKNTNANFKSLKLIYSKLLESEMDEKYVNGIINDIETSIKKEANLDSILASVYQKIILKLGEPESIKVGNKKKVVFFVGPTGVGKTTTIAKLASEYKINQNKKVALITADVYRIAAVEQLNTYASILDVPVNVIYSPSEIVDNVKDLSAYDVIMVDTAGRSHKNVEQRNELFEIVNNVKNAELDIDIDVFLVLSVTTKYRDLMNIANAYKELEGYKLLFTKLDETGTIGNIMNMRCYTGAPLSYITSGQNVPDDIELADVQKLAKMLLGGE
jgi:flagellar biosynthesis protein FlhF